MQNKSSTNIERIIAKIDNDFNPDGSDWIPRVGAWVVDAMSQLDVTKKETKRRKLKVTNGIAYSPCDIDTDGLKVFDANGCRIKEMQEQCCQCSIPLRGDTTSDDDLYDGHNQSCEVTPDTVDMINSNVNNSDKNYVIIDCNKIQVNFDTPYITIEHEEIKTECSSIYGCDLPVIPNNGLLIEAIAYYCMYKMLCRGYNHPVFNLKASQYGTNPYYEWNKLKDEAKRKSIIDAQGEVIDDSNLWQSAFYIYTFCR